MATLLQTEAAPAFLARSWQSEDGLPSNVVRAVAQAADGYLWVGTAEGVVRFDGQRFTGFRASTDARLERRAVRALFPLANGEVWVTTTGNALLRGRGARLEEVPLGPVADGTIARPISRVILGEGGEVFVLRGEAEVWKIVGNTITPVTERTPALEKLFQQDAASEERSHAVQGEPAVRLRSRRGAVWQFAPGTGLTFTDSAGLVEPVTLVTKPIVRSILEDREGNIWLATATQGLWRLRPARVEVLTTTDGLSDRIVRLVLEERNGALWVASTAGGLDYLSAGVAKHFDVGPAAARRPVSALLETRAGVLWAATRDSQVYIYKEGEFVPAFPKDRRVDPVVALAEDEESRIWLGGRYGLAVWDGSEVRVADLGAPENVVAVTAAGSIMWVGTESGRVFRGANGRFEPIAPANAFGQQPISSLLPDVDGSLWVGTIGDGLFQVREGRVVAIAPRMSEVDPRITCVLDDGAGFLWLGTLGGICRVEKTKLLDPASASVGTALVLDRSDGLLTRECTRTGQPAGSRGGDGTLYFSTGNGVARVHPQQLTLNTVPPPVAIEQASADRRPVMIGAARVQAGPGRSRLEFRYTALTFAAPEKVRFRTRLDGLDETWRDADGHRTAAYEAVPPGRYRFRVMAENGDGVWNEAGAALAVEVFPHFWETLWFQAGVALLAAVMAVGVGALIMRARMRGRMLRLEAQNSRVKERARIAQDLHDDLGTSLTEIALIANLAAEERPRADKEDDTLPEVAAKAQALVGALDEIVWAVNPRHDTLRSLAEYLAAFGEKFLGRAGITLRRDVSRDLPAVSLDAERRHNIFLAVREALNNAVKHSGASEVWLRMRLEAGELKVSISDNGRGISATADELSEGLRGMRERMERIGGTCQITSEASGTQIYFTLPLKAEHSPE